ncbi:MAG: thioredoxin domain-containing protein [Bacteriovoracia bacterium]
MEQKQGLTLQGITGKNFFFILNAVGMIAVGIYLTNHFYEVLYPVKLGGPGSLCDISNFFNCDAATYSMISNLAGIPISFFGIIVGLLFLFTSLMPSEALERTSSAVSKYNFIGCIVLFIYSITVLGSLCPFCTLYYVLSGIAAFLLWKHGINSWVPDMKVAGLWGVLLIIGSFLMYQNTKGKEDLSEKVSASVVEQYQKLPDLGAPDMESPYKIHMATEKFADAPIRITVFSDFQCPYCKVVAEQMPQLIRRYSDKINVQYMFYPLDAKCNANVKGRFHDSACDAAYLAACNPEKFEEVHDEIFANQEKLGSALGDIAQKYDLKGCMDNAEIKNKVIEAINQGTKYNLKSTPTIILNGKKIEGTIPNRQFFAIFDHILSTK